MLLRKLKDRVQQRYFGPVTQSMQKNHGQVLFGEIRNFSSQFQVILPDYMMPKLMKLPSIPKLTNGKVDRQSLIRKYEESLRSTFVFTDEELGEWVGADPAKIALARRLLNSVAHVLSCDRQPTLGDNFFQIGGDSLNMVQLLALMSDFGFHIGMTEFLQCKNLAEVVDQIVSEEDPGIISLLLRLF